MFSSYCMVNLHKLHEMLLSVKHHESTGQGHNVPGKTLTRIFQHIIQNFLNILANSFSKLFVPLLADFYPAFSH